MKIIEKLVRYHKSCNPRVAIAKLFVNTPESTSEAHLDPRRTFMMELSCENS